MCVGGGKTSLAAHLIKEPGAIPSLVPSDRFYQNKLCKSSALFRKG